MSAVQLPRHGDTRWQPRRRRSVSWWRHAALWCVGGVFGLGVATADTTWVGPPARSVDDWLVRLQQASTLPGYTGTYVVSAASGTMSKARIWHYCEDGIELERVDVLNGPSRSTFRHDDEVSVLLPQARVMRTEQRRSGAVFPQFLDTVHGHATANHYTVHEMGQDQVAGHDADVVLLLPRDDLRFGYRIWSEQQTGLLLKTQTLDASGQVLEQAAFSELQLDPPVQLLQDKLALPAEAKAFYQERLDRVPVDAQAEGWRLRQPVPGFEPRECYRRSPPESGPMLQWVFTDGLATVSMFLGPHDARRSVQEGSSVMGATHAMSRRWPEGDGSWWVTLVGEVPQKTLQAFVEGLERSP